MSSVVERFRVYYRFFSDLAEDILAITLCLPFTLALNSWNSVCDVLFGQPEIPIEGVNKLWRGGKFFLLMPLNIAKGLLGITLIPLAAFGAAMLPALKDKLVPEYTFPLAKMLIELRYSLRGFLLVLLYVPSVSLLPTNPLLDLMIIWTALFDQGMAGYLSRAFLSLEMALGFLMLAEPYLTPILMATLSLSPVFVVALAVSGTALYLDAHYHLIKEKLIELGQKIALKFGRNPFNNEEDLVDANKVHEIPLQNLFVSKSNHAFNLADMEFQVQDSSTKKEGVDPFVNHYKSVGDKKIYLDKKDVENLAKHPGLKSFPQLQKYINEHKNEFFNRNRPDTISNATLKVLKDFAIALGADQTMSTFAENLANAKEVYDNHLNTLSPVDKALVEKLNILGGVDPQYQLKNALDKAFDENPNNQACKHGISSLILETVDRVQLANLSGEKVKRSEAFWKRQHPTHWMMMNGRVLG